MQVSQSADHITHAVIGSQESVEMGVSDSAALMHILSSTLYTYPKLAMVQEVICNGWDAHIMVKKTNVPLNIEIRNNQFVVRDFGPGIPHEKIGQIYGVYGNSTKRDDSRQTGGFGLGSKAPFAYTDNFEVTSIHEGVKTVYRVSKSSMEVGGKPSINKIVSVPSIEPSGITVRVSIKENDIAEIQSMIKSTLILGEMLAKVNDEEPLETLPLLDSPSGFIITSAMGTKLTRINLRYGNVVYPIPVHPSYEQEWTAMSRAIGNLWVNAKIIFMAPPDSVSIAPSREALILTDNTLATIKELLGLFEEKDLDKASVTVNQLARKTFNEELKNKSPKEYFEVFLTGNSRFDVSISPTYVDDKNFFSFRKAFLGSKLAKSEWTIPQAKRIIRYIEEFSKKEPQLRKFAKDILKTVRVLKGETRAYEHIHGAGLLKTPVNKHVMAPVVIGIKNDENMKANKLSVLVRNPRYSATPMAWPKFEIVTVGALLSFLKTRVMIVKNKQTISETFYAGCPTDMHGAWLIYQVGRKEEEAAYALDFFTKLGFEVVVKIPEPVKEEAVLVDGVPVVKEVKPQVKSPKRIGYLSLASSMVPRTKEFLLNTARENTPAGGGIHDPVAWVVLKNKSEGAKTFARLNEEECLAINELFGGQIAVVTTPQANKLLKDGVPQLSNFIDNYVDQKLTESKDFPRYIAFGYQGIEARHYDRATKIVCAAALHEHVMKELNLRFHVSPETAMLLTFYNANSHRRETKERFPQAHAKAQKIKPNPQFGKLVKKVEKSPYVAFLDMVHLSSRLNSAVPGSTESDIAVELSLKLLK
jgi:hypothetical protein